MKKLAFYSAGVFQSPSETVEIGRNNTHNHTGSPCPCKLTNLDVSEEVRRMRREPNQRDGAAKNSA